MERFIHYDEELGRGAFKRVFKAFDKQSGASVAWSEVPLGSLSAEEFKATYREVALLRQLEHPNILRLLDHWVDEERSVLVFVSELVGVNLAQAIRRLRVVPMRVVAQWTREIFQGLAYLHARHVIHRDIKPQNILLDPQSNQLKICDLGLAKLIDKGMAEHSMVGTQPFMAPEIYSGVYDERVDVWAAGLVALQMVTRHPPYEELQEGGIGQFVRVVSAGTLPAALSLLRKNTLCYLFITRCLQPKEARPTSQELLMDKFLTTPDLPGTIEDAVSAPPSARPRLQSLGTATLRNNKHAPTLHFSYCLSGCTWISLNGRLFFIALDTQLVDSMLYFETEGGSFDGKARILPIRSELWDARSRPRLGICGLQSISAPIGNDRLYLLTDNLLLVTVRLESEPEMSAYVTAITSLASLSQHALEGLSYNEGFIYLGAGDVIIYAQASDLFENRRLEVRPLSLRENERIRDVSWNRTADALLILTTHSVYMCDVHDTSHNVRELPAAAELLKTRSPRGLCIRGDKLSFVFDRGDEPILLAQSLL